MTSAEWLKKIGIGADKITDGKNDGKLKSQVLKHLKDGKSKILSLEKKIKNDKNYKTLLARIDKSKNELQRARQTFDQYEQKAEEYIEKNPKKAIAMAAAAGAIAASVWATFNKKKPVVRKKK